VTAYCRLRFPERRRRDADNFRALLSKALGDALQNIGLIPDDTPEFYDMAALTFSAEPGAPQTRIFLELLYLNGKEGS
jgi:Holliday junction resolvase RusA-like endonuclease